MLDLYSRRGVGWSMGTTLESRLVVDTLHTALQHCGPEEGLLAHSDRGSQYASEYDQRVLCQHGVTCRRSRAGNCCDNAPPESLFASLKKERVHHEDCPTIEAAKASVFETIAMFYNRIRRHSSLGTLPQRSLSVTKTLNCEPVFRGEVQCARNRRRCELSGSVRVAVTAR